MRQYSTQRFLPVIVIGILCAAFGVAHAQPIADELPATTLVYTGWSPSAAMLDTKAARMLADERIVGRWKVLIASYLQSLPADAQEGGAVAEHLPRLLEDAAQCEGCFALLDVRKADKGRLSPQAVFILNLGAKKSDFEAHFKPIHERLKKILGDSVHLMKVEKSWLWSKTEHERDEYFWGFVGDRFIVYYGDGGEAFLRAMARGKPEKPLAAAPEFVACLARIPGDSVMTAYVAAPPLFALLRDVMEQGSAVNDLTENWQKVLIQAGLDNVKSLGEKATIQDQQFVTRTLLHTDGAPHGLLPALIQPAVDEAMLKCVPPDAMAVASFRLDLGKTYDQLKAASIAIGGSDASKSFADFEQHARDAGLPVHDVLAPLGDQWVGYNAASTGGLFFTGWTLVGTVKDPAGLTRQVETIVKLQLGNAPNGQGATRREYAVDGVTIHYIEFGGMFEFFTPAWAQVGDKLVIAIFPQIVEDAVRQLSADKSILDNPAFMATRKLTGHDGPSAYLSGPEVVTNLYPFLIIYAQFINGMSTAFGNGGGTALGAPSELLPSMQRLLQYVGSDGVDVKVTPDGILRTKSVANPLLSPLTLTDNIPLIVALAIPSLTEARTSADRTKSASNLRQIGQGLMLYANDNKGSLPPDFATLRKTQELADDVFNSPTGTARSGPDYVYLFFPGMKSNVNADVVVAYDAAELESGDGANVLFGDGHVEYLDGAAAAAAIEKAHKAHPDIIEPAKQKNGGKLAPDLPAPEAPK